MHTPRNQIAGKMENATGNTSEKSPPYKPENREHLNSEPLPDWIEAEAIFSWGWEFHWISFVVLFLGLAFYSTVRLVTTSRKTRLREKVSRNVAYAVHSLIIVLGITRALALVLFPYEVTTNVTNADIVIPLYVHRIIFGLGFPCFMAAFALIQITFTVSIKTTPLTHSKLRKVRFLVLLIVGHFSVVIIADVITALVENTSALFMVCTAYLLFMTLFTGIRITKSGCKIVRESKGHSVVIDSMGSTNTIQAPSCVSYHVRRASFNSKAVRKVFLITALTIFFCFALFALKIYDLVQVIEFTFVPGKNKPLAPWPWFIHETLFRLTEFSLACTVLYAVSPLKSRKKSIFGCFRRCCKTGKNETDLENEIPRPRTATNEMVISNPLSRPSSNLRL